jgi:pantoate--beta-alanine ligase
MKIIENKTELLDFLKNIRKQKKKIGLIPTMGSIHKGHLSLIKNCQKLGFFSLVTIFVNPTQFNDLKDFNLYPRDRENDIKYLELANTNSLFFPSSEDLYPEVVKSEKTIFQYRNILCDIYRPGHFDGVTTVVNSLINLIQPNHIFFGEKDFQQLKIIQKILENNIPPVIMHSCPSIRMSNGMSYSSRYKKFSISDEVFFNNVATLIMYNISKLKKDINFKILESLECELKERGVIKIDYIEIRDDINLQLTKEKINARLFISFYINKIRIIDNFILY